jgi:hypothetical protein
VDALPVIEHVEVCTDAARVSAAVEENVRLALSRGVTVRVDFGRIERHAEARAVIMLPDGTAETRSFSSATRTCAPLARALGAWVSVRMDEWSERQKTESEAAAAKQDEKPAPATPTTATSAPAPKNEAIAALPISSGFDPPFDVDRDGRRIADPHGPEITANSSLIGNLARYTLVGGSIGATLAMSDTFVLRGFGFGYTAAVNKTAAFGYRMDACRRVPGRYARFRGMALDLCAGGEAGVLDRSAYGAFGPSMTIHGDLTRSLALDLGGGFALPFGDTVYHPTGGGLSVAVRGDLGLTWRLP